MLSNGNKSSIFYHCNSQERVERLQSANKSPIGSIKGMDKTEIAFKLADKNKDGYIDKEEFEGFFFFRGTLLRPTKSF